ncbi:unnamed protein product [Acanthoscelides obtectus]|uniref:Uncharacterized protein n=1 Tax=Acanthoscelides obtectus TaxID=200917 RepID=A0A9P0PI73_ACAOB|nr:unnamed protein product [Acanthoscelides obtectus]CAK1649500.1 hypothetical protein AOBTE_LOCUS16276 [Acanthoscelides obtectus]
MPLILAHLRNNLNPGGECQNNDCCNVCVPITKTSPPEPPKKPRRKCKYIQPPRPKSYAPQRNYIAPEMKMEDNTIYRKSYVPVEAEKPVSIVPEGNLCVGDGKMSDDTINRMSYQPHKAKSVTKPSKKCPTSHGNPPNPWTCLGQRNRNSCHPVYEWKTTLSTK